MEFRDKQYDVFNMFDKQWALATAGTLEDFTFNCYIAIR